MQIMCVCEFSVYIRILTNIQISEFLLLRIKEPQKPSFSLSFFDLVIYISIQGPPQQHSFAAML